MDKPISKEEALIRIEIDRTLRQMVMEGISLGVALEKYGYASGVVERHAYSLTGLNAHLTKQFYALWKLKATEKLAKEKGLR